MDDKPKAMKLSIRKTILFGRAAEPIVQSPGGIDAQQSDDALRGCVDVLVRMIPDYCADEQVQPCTDAEHNAAIAAAALVLFGADRRGWPRGIRKAADGTYD
jgi:hypothetical protein